MADPETSWKDYIEYIVETVAALATIAMYVVRGHYTKAEEETDEKE